MAKIPAGQLHALALLGARSLVKQLEQLTRAPRGKEDAEKARSIREHLSRKRTGTESEDGPRRKHWTQTPRGRRRMSQAGKARWAKMSRAQRAGWQFKLHAGKRAKNG